MKKGCLIMLEPEPASHMFTYYPDSEINLGSGWHFTHICRMPPEVQDKLRNCEPVIISLSTDPVDRTSKAYVLAQPRLFEPIKEENIFPYPLWTICSDEVRRLLNIPYPAQTPKIIYITLLTK